MIRSRCRGIAVRRLRPAWAKTLERTKGRLGVVRCAKRCDCFTHLGFEQGGIGRNASIDDQFSFRNSAS